MKYAIWCVERSSWWCPDRFGYTRLKEEAGLYEEEEAFEIVRDANQFGHIYECLVPDSLFKREDVTKLFGVA